MISSGFIVPDIGAETIASAIKGVLLKLQLSLVYCRGQCYDGASNMMGHKTGVAKRIQDLQPNALNLKPMAYLTFAPLDGQYAQAVFSES